MSTENANAWLEVIRREQAISNENRQRVIDQFAGEASRLVAEQAARNVQKVVVTPELFRGHDERITERSGAGAP